MNPKILITNDDGIFSSGINALSDVMSEIGDVTIVAPNNEQSAKSHALTLQNPIKIEAVSLRNGFQGWSVQGTPVDCVKLALKSLLHHKPNLIISGINQGANLGRNLIYSGTVSAAYEGAILGIPSLAISLDSFKNNNFKCSKFVAKSIAKYVLKHIPPKGTMLNVNVPNIDIDSLKGYLITRQGNQYFLDDFEKRDNPRNETYYWITGKKIDEDSSIDFDGRAVSEGYVSITPIHFDLTNTSYLNELKTGWTDGF